MSTLDQLRKYTTIVVDTGDFRLLENYNPQDCTTNPSHILLAAKQSQYSHIVYSSVNYGISKSEDIVKQVEHANVRLHVAFGIEILKKIQGRVSTEVDAIHTFNTENTLNAAREIIRLYEESGISRERILIKIASTWEGLQACKVLEKEGIHCNMTVLFSLVQAKLAAEVGATMISPFMSRTMDWWQKNYPGRDYTGNHDPGVKLVREIHNYYEEASIKTQIMPASLRSIDECVHLASIEFMTMNPKILQELKDTEYLVRPQFSKNPNGNINSKQIAVVYAGNEPKFRLDIFNDHVASDKIPESIRIFLNDGHELKAMLEEVIKHEVKL
ncbi:hypothetical protein B7463_g10545, partial [Scytalidium lignicola]